MDIIGKAWPCFPGFRPRKNKGCAVNPPLPDGCSSRTWAKHSFWINSVRDLLGPDIDDRPAAKMDWDEFEATAVNSGKITVQVKREVGQS